MKSKIAILLVLLINQAISQTFRNGFDNRDFSSSGGNGQGASYYSNVSSKLHNDESVFLIGYMNMFFATHDKKYLDQFIIHTKRVQERRDDNILTLSSNELIGFPTQFFDFHETILKGHEEFSVYPVDHSYSILYWKNEPNHASNSVCKKKYLLPEKAKPKHIQLGFYGTLNAAFPTYYDSTVRTPISLFDNGYFEPLLNIDDTICDNDTRIAEKNRIWNLGLMFNINYLFPDFYTSTNYYRIAKPQLQYGATILVTYGHSRFINIHSGISFDRLEAKAINSGNPILGQTDTTLSLKTSTYSFLSIPLLYVINILENKYRMQIAPFVGLSFLYLLENHTTYQNDSGQYSEKSFFTDVERDILFNTGILYSHVLSDHLELKICAQAIKQLTPFKRYEMSTAGHILEEREFLTYIKFSMGLAFRF
ncbi:MAG: outer membrane beta-barrel protein [Crocinitomicaceae bacterium]|nr:outer membrane beta-barrel protein [Crocinitomicaceae bacterium]